MERRTTARAHGGDAARRALARFAEHGLQIETLRQLADRRRSSPAPEHARRAARPAATEDRPSPARRPGAAPRSAGGLWRHDLRGIDASAIRIRAALDRVALPMSRVAHHLLDRKVWTSFGYARLEDYARERLGRTGRWLRDLGALHRAVARLPALGVAVAGSDGRSPLGRVATLLVARVATAETADAWIAHARQVSVRTLRDDVRRALATSGKGAAQRAVSTPGPEVATPGGRAEPAAACAPAPAPEDGRLSAGRSRPEPTPPVMALPPAAPDSHAATAGAGVRSHLQERLVAITEPRFIEDEDATVRQALRERRRRPDDAGCLAGDAALGELINEDLQRVILTVPAQVDAGFHDGLELYRALVGHDAPLRDFVEALVAEAAAGPLPPDVEVLPVFRRPGTARREEALARATENWRCLAPGVRRADPLIEDVGRALARLADAASHPGECTAEELESRLRDLLSLEEDLEILLGKVLARMSETRQFAELRFAGVGHYCEERLGMSRSSGQNRARLTRGLARYTELRDAYEAGRLPGEAALVLLRLFDGRPVDRHSQRAWLRRAARYSVKRLRDEVRALRIRPAFEESEWPPLPMADAEWHASLRRHPGSTRRRLRSLGNAVFQGAEPERELRLTLPCTLADSFLGAIESGRQLALNEARSLATVATDGRTRVLASRAAMAAETFSAAGQATPAWVGLLWLLEDFARTWDDPRGHPRRRSAATYNRDGWRCMAPGCSSRRHLEEHHIVYRSRGGGHESHNRICLCRFHHQQGEHGQYAICRGRAPLGVTWVLGRFGSGGRWINERRAPVDGTASGQVM